MYAWPFLKFCSEVTPQVLKYLHLKQKIILAYTLSIITGAVVKYLMILNFACRPHTACKIDLTDNILQGKTVN